MSKKNKTSIGGQAVLEGVMMRGNSAVATAVRDSKGKIQVESSRFKPLKERSVFYKIPIVRGVLAFVGSLVTGMKSLTRASEVFGEIEDKKTSNIVMFIGVAIGLLLAVGLFVIIPQYATQGIDKLVGFSSIENLFLRSFVGGIIAGAIRIIIFIAYLLLISLMKDIKRLFRYHGAEHKTISCYENQLPLTVENIRKMPKIHDRCGTTFIFLVMIVSIIAFSLTGWQENTLIRILIRIAGIPIVAGISYEILMFLAKFDNVFVNILKAPGLLLQKITTAEPDDSMIEVALIAFETVLKLQEDENFPTSKFFTATERAKLCPPQYKEGKAPFYGYEFKVDESVLIPRFDTEILVEQAILLLKEYKKEEPIRILDLGTGSGAIAITISLETAKENIKTAIFATDSSKNALKIAAENAELLNANVTFDALYMFQGLQGKFDFIISNPPHIPTNDIETLDPMVKEFEPRLALDGGEDGMKFYRIIAKEYKKYLNNGGYLLMEIGINQLESIKEIFQTEIKTVKDYNNPPIERVVIIKKDEDETEKIFSSEQTKALFNEVLAETRVELAKAKEEGREVTAEGMEAMLRNAFANIDIDSFKKDDGAEKSFSIKDLEKMFEKSLIEANIEEVFREAEQESLKA